MSFQVVCSALGTNLGLFVGGAVPRHHSITSLGPMEDPSMGSGWESQADVWVTIECQHLGHGPILDVLHVEDDIYPVVSLQEQHLVFPLICTEI